MMNFIIMTLSFTVAILLAGVLGTLIVLNPLVMKWYAKKVNKVTKTVFEETLKDLVEAEGL